MTDPTSNQRNADGLLVIDDEDVSMKLDPAALAEITSGLRISRKYFIARASAPERATAFLARGFSVIIAQRGFAEALPDLAARVASSGRIFANPGVGAVIARSLKGEQRISALARTTDRISNELKGRLSSVLYIDTAVCPLPPALHI